MAVNCRRGLPELSRTMRWLTHHVGGADAALKAPRAAIASANVANRPMTRHSALSPGKASHLVTLNSEEFVLGLVPGSVRVARQKFKDGWARAGTTASASNTKKPPRQAAIARLAEVDDRILIGFRLDSARANTAERAPLRTTFAAEKKNWCEDKHRR
jgi:hypothetical protein